MSEENLDRRQFLKAAAGGLVGATGGKMLNDAGKKPTELQNIQQLPYETKEAEVIGHSGSEYPDHSQRLLTLRVGERTVDVPVTKEIAEAVEVGRRFPVECAVDEAGELQIRNLDALGLDFEEEA